MCAQIFFFFLKLCVVKISQNSVKVERVVKFLKNSVEREYDVKFSRNSAKNALEKLLP